jgi:hypothetical protein
MRPSLLVSQTQLTFTDYFKLNLDIDEVAAHFGYTYIRQNLALPRTDADIPWLTDLYDRLQSGLPYISLTNEMARREFLIAPIVFDLARFLHVKVKVEFPIDVNSQLRGTLDYYLQAQQNLLIIEAKNADLQRGFIQLTAELIALDQVIEVGVPYLYGAVSIGDVWQFGLLNRATKQIAQDLQLYRVPADLNELVQIIIAVLKAPVVSI